MGGRIQEDQMKYIAALVFGLLLLFMGCEEEQTIDWTEVEKRITATNARGEREVWCKRCGESSYVRRDSWTCPVCKNEGVFDR